jgi:hypothetical protein
MEILLIRSHSIDSTDDDLVRILRNQIAADTYPMTAPSNPFTVAHRYPINKQPYKRSILKVQREYFFPYAPVAISTASSTLN